MTIEFGKLPKRLGKLQPNLGSGHGREIMRELEEGALWCAVHLQSLATSSFEEKQRGCGKVGRRIAKADAGKANALG